MNYQPDALQSGSGMPRGRSLYGTLPEQLDDADSFARRLAELLRVRDESGIATATQLDVPATSHHGLLVMVHSGVRDPDSASSNGTTSALQATVLNFSTDDVTTRIASGHFEPGWTARDVLTGEDLGVVDDLQSLAIDIQAHTARFVLFGKASRPGSDGS
jgi:hypothetical protein